MTLIRSSKRQHRGMLAVIVATAIIFATVFLVAILTGCSGSGASRSGDVKPAEHITKDSEITQVYDGSVVNLFEAPIYLSDGREVTCIVLTGYRQGGLSCDWLTAAVPAE